jgi:hypothetical protein
MKNTTHLLNEAARELENFGASGLTRENAKRELAKVLEQNEGNTEAEYIARNFEHFALVVLEKATK